MNSDNEMQGQALVNSKSRTASPFLKWAGGKTQLLDELGLHIPRFETYFEPFLGGGALFFYLASGLSSFRAHLSDLNPELVNAYQAVKNNVNELIDLLGRHEIDYATQPKSFYYRLRNEKPSGKLEKAARLVALNKTCYNGLYRVNSAGEFNVPIGRYKNPTICNAQALRIASSALARTKATVRVGDYAEVLKEALKGDFVYLDPPFVPLSKTAKFVDYTKAGFSERDQLELAAVFRKLHGKRCKVLLSNSDTKLARELYSDFDQFRVKAARSISCKGAARTGYTELLVRNYTP